MINRVVLMGRITADPEIKLTTNGVEYSNFRIAVDRRFTTKGEEKQTDFINIVVWRQTAAFVNKYFHKGSMVALEGSIQTRSYEDKNGNKRTAFEVVADNVSFCGGKSDSSATSEQAQPSNRQADFDDVDDDLPF